MTAIIRASVGRGGYNNKSDVRIIQRLLNEATPTGQGPLAVDGIVGPKTIAAIQSFQKVAGGVVDGRVDPHGPTIKRLARRHIENVAAGLSPEVLLLAQGYSLPSPPLPQTLVGEYFRLPREP